MILLPQDLAFALLLCPGDEEFTLSKKITQGFAWEGGVVRLGIDRYISLHISRNAL